MPAATAHLFRLDAKDFRDTDAELFRLDQRLDEGVQLFDAGTAAHVIQRLETRPAEPDFVEHLGELIGQRILELFRQPTDGGIEAKSGFDRDGQQVERVRQGQSKFFLAAFDLVVQPDIGQVAPQHEAQTGRAQP